MASANVPPLSDYPLLPELLDRMQRAGGCVGRSTGDERVAFQKELTAAQVMYHVIKLLDAAPELITAEAAERICAVIATRVDGAQVALPLGATSRDDLHRLLGGAR